MKRRLVALGLAAVLLAGMIAGCRSPQPAADTSIPVVTDQLGRSVKLDRAPERIVSIAPSNTEILFALGLGDKVVGVTSYDDYPPEAQSKDKVGGFSTPDIERIVTLNPDLVVATNTHETKVIPELEKRGIRVVALYPRKLADVLDGISLIGKIWA